MDGVGEKTRNAGAKICGKDKKNATLLIFNSIPFYLVKFYIA